MECVVCFGWSLYLFCQLYVMGLFSIFDMCSVDCKIKSTCVCQVLYVLTVHIISFVCFMCVCFVSLTCAHDIPCFLMCLNFCAFYLMSSALMAQWKRSLPPVWQSVIQILVETYQRLFSSVSHPARCLALRGQH